MSQKSSQTAQVNRIANALKEAERKQDKSLQIDLYKKLLKLTPDLPLAHAQIARLLLESEEEEAALPHIEKALLGPSNEQIDNLIFNESCKRKRFIENLAQAEKWYQQSPNLYRFKLFYEALIYAEKYEESEQLLLQILQTKLTTIQQSQILSLLAQTYYNTGRFYDSIACSQLGLEQNPGDKDLHFNLAVAYESVGRYEESFRNYAVILEEDPNHIATHNNLAYVMLRLGQFEEGWRHYEWRWAKVLKDHEQHFNIPRWQGEPLEGKTLLVWAEQGIGDHIMFASMLPDLQKLGGVIYFEIYERLDPLFKRSFPEINFIRREQAGTAQDGQQILHRQSWPYSNYHIPMGSLGRFFRPSLESFPHRKNYLKADHALTEQFRSDYKKLFPGKKLIGISWRGGANVSNNKQSRQIPLQELQILAKEHDLQLINLQYGNTASEREEALAYGVKIYDDERVNPFKDIDTQAAQIAALDAVISIDNTSVHLAGALGVPTYTLLQLSPNWRWGLKEGPSYWYPSVKTFRNRTLKTWIEVLERIVESLKEDRII